MNKSIITGCGRKSRSSSPKITVDVADLLFTPYRRFLIRNNGPRVWVDELKGKTIVLFIVPIVDDHRFMKPAGDTLDMIHAYHELLPLGGTEFVFVPVYIPNYHNHYRNKDDHDHDCCARFNDILISTIPFPAVPLSDIEACGDRVVNTFSVTMSWPDVSYWVIIDPTGTVVTTRRRYPLSLPRIRSLFKLFERGDRRICLSSACLVYRDERRESRKRLILNWDRLLASPTRDFLVLSSNGGRVPISSLKGKVIGLYFCENVPCPPRMEVIKEAYREAKLRGYDFEIVQINYHYEILHARHTAVADFSEQQHYENINWLTLPFKDPSCRKLQRIFECTHDPYFDLCRWRGDCLVILDTRRRPADEVIFEFCGAEIIEHYGIQGYPFTRQSLIEREYTM